MRKAAKRSGSFNASVPTARLTRFTQGRWPRTAAPSRSTPVGTALRKRVRRSAVRYQSYPPNPSSSPSDRKSTRLNSSHDQISYAVFCLKKKKHKQYSLHHQNQIPLICLDALHSFRVSFLLNRLVAAPLLSVVICCLHLYFTRYSIILLR